MRPDDAAEARVGVPVPEHDVVGASAAVAKWVAQLVVADDEIAETVHQGHSGVNAVGVRGIAVRGI